MDYAQPRSDGWKTIFHSSRDTVLAHEIAFPLSNLADASKTKPQAQPRMQQGTQQALFR